MDAPQLDMKTLPVEKKKLLCPPLNELADGVPTLVRETYLGNFHTTMLCVTTNPVILRLSALKPFVTVLSKGLPSTFVDVRCEVVDCPNLTLPPFHLAAEGFGGSTGIVDIGGPPYLLPTVKREKLYNFKSLGEMCGGVEPAFIVGAGAGPWPYANTNCEMVANVKVSNGQVHNATRIVKMTDVEQENFAVEVLPDSETRFALLANFFISQGKPGKVLKINCKRRKGEDNFITAIRNALQTRYGHQPVALGGVFILNSGKVKQHIMNDFSSEPIKTEADLNNWLFFHDMNAPLVALGTLISEDPGLDLRVQHFHSFNLQGEGGHYHYDTTPNTVEYTAYFSTAEYLYRIDKPLETHGFGRD